MKDEEQSLDIEEQGISEPIMHDEEQGIDIGQNCPDKKKRKAAKQVDTAARTSGIPS